MLLTLELLPVLVSTAQSCGDGRIAFVSSKTNSVAESVEADKLLVTREEDYNRLRTYPNTKLYNVSALRYSSSCNTLVTKLYLV